MVDKITRFGLIICFIVSILVYYFAFEALGLKELVLSVLYYAATIGQ